MPGWEEWRKWLEHSVQIMGSQDRQCPCARAGVFQNYVNISARSYGFNYTHSGMFFWLSVAFYGSLWVHGAPPWPCAHPALIPMASPNAIQKTVHSVFSGL